MLHHCLYFVTLVGCYYFIDMQYIALCVLTANGAPLYTGSETWPGTAVFLCLWHVRRAWQKNSCYKIPNLARRATILKELGMLMYDRSSPPGEEGKAWAQHRIEELAKKYPGEVDFWDYVRTQWIDKVHMWVVGFRNLSYCGQDTNAAIEGYHGFAKSILKSERSRMIGRRVDWCITALTEDVLDHYWYKDLRKEKGFVDNKKMQDCVVESILKARAIPDEDVTLPVIDGDTALVTSTEHRHLRYTVHNPGSEWGVCNCVWAQRGNICKHHVKVVMMMNPEIAEGTIARYCGRLAGNVNGGLQQLLTPRREQPPPPSETVTPASAPRPTPSRHRAMDLPETLQNQVILLAEEVAGDTVMMEHLVTEFNQTLGRLRRMKAEIQSGSVHPMAGSPVFHPVVDGQGFKLGRRKDFLERSWNPVSRRL